MMTYDLEGDGEVNKYNRRSVHTYKTFDKTIVDNHPRALSKGYVPYSTSSESLESVCILSETSDKLYSSGDVNSPPDTFFNHDVVNNHMNYQLFYNRNGTRNSDGEIDRVIWSAATTSGSENSTVDKIPNCINNLTISEESIVSDCDIEQCLMQIEKSLVNIEQNLLHVYDHDIPQLNKFIHKRSDNGEYYGDNMNKVTRDPDNSNRPSSENCLASKNFVVSNERLSRSDNDINIIEENVNFKCDNCEALPLNIPLFDAYNNLTQCNFKECNLSESHKLDIINCHSNIDNNIELKKSTRHRNKSVNDNHDVSIYKHRKSSLNNYFSKSNIPPIVNMRKASSQDILAKHTNESLQIRRKCRELYRHSINIHSSEYLFDQVNRNMGAFHNKGKTKNAGTSCESLVDSETTLLPQDVYEKITPQQNEDIAIGGKISADNHKNINYDNRVHLVQPSECAIVPNKLLSLSFSLLLAALLQAVRCLADLVEDAFRSVTFGKYALND